MLLANYLEYYESLFLHLALAFCYISQVYTDPLYVCKYEGVRLRVVGLLTYKLWKNRGQKVHSIAVAHYEKIYANTPTTPLTVTGVLDCVCTFALSLFCFSMSSPFNVCVGSCMIVTVSLSSVCVCVCSVS